MIIGKQRQQEYVLLLKPVLINKTELKTTNLKMKSISYSFSKINIGVFKIIVTLFLINLFFSCDKDDLSEVDFQNEIKSLWNSYTSKFPDEHVESAYLALHYPQNTGERDIVFSYGESMPGIKSTVNDQLYLASTGKMLCATVVLQLMEESLLALDDKIADYLDATIIDGLHIYDGKDYSKQITIRQLLEHSSGIPDFIFDKTSGSSSFIDLLLQNNLDEIWTAEETIEFSKKYQTPVSKPGKMHYYTDTGYNLLGLLIEKVTGKDLASVYRERIFEAYNLDQSFMPFYEDPVENTGGGIWANSYFYDHTSGINCGEVDHPNVFSFEFGGGNWVATISDIHKYMQALVSGTLFQNIDTRNEMLKERWPAGSLIIDDLWYGYGMFIFDGKHGKIYGHGGANNTWVVYIPRYDSYVTIVFNQVETKSVSAFFMLREVANLLEQYSDID